MENKENTGALKRSKIKEMVLDMLQRSFELMPGKIDKVLNSGAIDIDSWDESDNPMILPKCIVVAILQSESSQYDAKGTAFEKQVKKEAKNIELFI